MKFRFAHDHWKTREITFAYSGPLSYDKVQHLIGGFILSVLFGPLWASFLALLWEVKDGLVPWEAGYRTYWPVKYNWGGDGFSWRDLVASIGGALVGALIHALL